MFLRLPGRYGGRNLAGLGEGSEIAEANAAPQSDRRRDKVETRTKKGR
jgi:hypothetical protein